MFYQIRKTEFSKTRAHSNFKSSEAFLQLKRIPILKLTDAIAYGSRNYSSIDSNKRIYFHRQH